MAAKEKKVEGNVPGPYYVDSECTACGMCANTAPKNFQMGDKYAFVGKQPENDEEKNKCEEAVGQCPVQAIGNDGQ